MTPGGPITRLLTADHARMSALLARACEGDVAACEELRGALLRHIGIEEKILLPAMRARTGATPSVAAQLHLDHSAIAAMLVPPASRDLLARLAELLALHDPLEEGEGGLYAQADAALAGDSDVLDRMQRAPLPPLAKHFDDERAFRAIDALVAKAMAARDRT